MPMHSIERASKRSRRSPRSASYRDSTSSSPTTRWSENRSPVSARRSSTGLLVYTCQPWHPQLELIARALTSHRGGEPWVMRRRTQAEIDQLVERAGFRKVAQRINEEGLFTVLARRAPRAMTEALAAAPASGRPWARAFGWLAFLGPFFFITYGLATWATAQRSHVGALVFDWERIIPFVAGRSSRTGRSIFCMGSRSSPAPIAGSSTPMRNAC
jgi:hypothetical protein